MVSAAERRKQVVALKQEMQRAMKAEKDRRKRNQIEAEYESKIAALSGKKPSEVSEDDEKPIDLSKFTFVDMGTNKAHLKKEEKERQRREEHKRRINELEVTDRSSVEEADIQGRLDGGRLVSIQPDGNCLFRAIEHQLELVRGVKKPFRELRAIAADHLRQHKDDYVFFVEEEYHTDEGYERFCQSIQDTDAYGGEIEITVLSKELNVPIKVIKSGGCVVYGEDLSGPELTLSFHRFLYGSPHYNSVIKGA